MKWNGQDGTVTHGCLALNSEEARPEIQDEVTALAVGERPKHTEAKLDRRVRDCGLRDRALLIRRQLHVLRIENEPDTAVAGENGP